MLTKKTYKKMKKYKVFWEVRKFAIVRAKDEITAINKVWDGSMDDKIQEGEITEQMDAVVVEE